MTISETNQVRARTALPEVCATQDCESNPAEAPVDVGIVQLPPLKRRLRRITTRPLLMHYNRLAASVVVANLVVVLLAMTRWQWWSSGEISLGAISNVMLANFSLAIIIRQQYVINLLFKIATSAPTTWPLAIRWTLAKIYHFGGLHVGGAVAGTGWFVAFTVSLWFQWSRGLGGVSTALLVVSVMLVVLLIGIVALALPPVRAKHHDLFERSHRFGGWAALVLFWVHAGVFVADQSQIGGSDQSWIRAFSGAPSFWLLIAISTSIALPWLRLRRVPIEIDSPSRHVALTRFDHGVTPFAGSASAVSRNPVLEWHSFANVPTPGVDGFRLTISRSGDWTGQLIDEQPSHLWVKGIPTAGVANIETLFDRVIYVATGSGIGPCLPHLLEGKVPSRLIWATRDARSTYGDKLVDEILDVQPDAVIWDTTLFGKPDMVKLAFHAYREFDAEAVICISNKVLTWQVVTGMEQRGIPAYGAIWDS